MNWEIVYEYLGDEKPVEDFIKSLDKRSIAGLSKAIDLLQNYGNLLRMPHSKKITKDIFELRIKGVESIRSTA